MWRRLVPAACIVGSMAVMGCGPMLSTEDPAQAPQHLVAGGTDPLGPCALGAGASSRHLATADVTLDRSTPNVNHGADASCTVRGGSARTRHCLLRWDLSAIVPSTTVLGACLTLNISATDGSASSFNGYEVVRNWVESSATWKQASTAEAWEGPGAWNDSDSGAAVIARIPPSAGGLVSVGLSTDLVQQWVMDPSSNHGIVFGGGTGDGVSFSTKEATGADAGAPRLSIYE